MKRNNKNLACLTLALGLVFSATVMPYSAHALEKNDKRIEISYTQKKAKVEKTQKTQKKQGTKKITVVENKKTKGIRYPQKGDNWMVYPKAEDDWMVYPQAGDNSMVYPKAEDDWMVYPQAGDDWMVYPKAEDDWMVYPKAEDDWMVYPKVGDDWMVYPQARDNMMLYPQAQDAPITYPDYIANVDVMPAIVDEEDAFDYLFSVLSNIPKYKLGKHRIQVEKHKDLPSASGAQEWYFAYGPKKGKFTASKYFAVDKNGVIFEYNAKKNLWSPLVLAVKK